MIKSFTRRDTLGLSAGSLFALGLWPGALRAQDAGKGGNFRFVWLNDTHYIDEKCGEFLVKVMAQIKASTPKPDFVIFGGDVTDHGSVGECGGAREAYRTLDIPFRVVIGNHDYASSSDRNAWENHFPDSLNYHFEHNGWQFVGLDTTQGTEYQMTDVQAPTLRWLDDQLPKLDRTKPTVIVTHFPLALATQWRPYNADKVLDRFMEHNLVAVFSGHFHSFTERVVGSTILTTNRCCSLKIKNHDGTKEKGYFVCTAKDGKLSREFVEVAVA